MRLMVMIMALAACGDGEVCAPPQGPLPTGQFSDPHALPLPDGCVHGGLVELPGRWFMADPTQSFYFWYPQFEGSCSTGFHRSFLAPDDHDAQDGFTFYTWSDGTLYFERTEYASGVVFASAYCARADGTLAGVDVLVGDQETTITKFTGERFAPKDELARGLALVGQAGADTNGAPISALDLAIDGGFAYVAAQGGLEIFDVRNPAAPVAVGRYAGSYNDVVIVHGDGRTIAYVSPFRGQHTQAIDVTDPRAPTLAVQIPDYSHTLFHTTRDGGSQLYFATYTDYIPEFDVSHPLAPVRINETFVPGPMSGVHDMFVDGDRIYASYTGAGLVAFDVSAGFDQPVELGHIATSYSHTNVKGIVGGRPVVLHGDEGMTATAEGAAFLRILDGDPSSPAFLTELASYHSRPEVGIHNFQLVGNRLYIAYYQDGVRVLDLSDPTHPLEIAHYNTWDPSTAFGSSFEGALSVQVVGNLIYVADDLRGLVILRDPALPQ